ncbi:MAG: HD domain-containing protein [Caldilineaceae bacterium]|nr:HD domain-containing protein [Caldilineaceae bacterium]
MISPKPWLPLRIFYRLRQFVRGITAHVSADEMLVVAQVLPKAALTRFCHMPLDAQRHSLNVLYMLQREDLSDPDLAAAALLHDVGKSAAGQIGVQLSPWLKGPLVLLDALLPQWIAGLAQNDPAQGWRYLLHVHLAHPSIGAQWAAEADCSELTCWLIEHHQDTLSGSPQTYNEELLTLLQWADSRN